MEIEAKFRVISSNQFEHLCALERISGYAFREAPTRSVIDDYRDTASGLIRRGGYALRLRRFAETGAWVATLKGLGQAQGAIHTRAEHEVALSADLPPSLWSPGAARDLAQRLSLGEPLHTLFTIEQTRRLRALYGGSRLVGELSLDETFVQVGGQRHEVLELEIELGPAGSLTDLKVLSEALLDYGLEPEPRSKYERAWQLLQT